VGSRRTLTSIRKQPRAQAKETQLRLWRHSDDIVSKVTSTVSGVCVSDEWELGVALAEALADAPASLPPRNEYVRLQEAVAVIAGTAGVRKRGRQWFPHPFSARMPAAVAEAAVQQLTKPGDVVLDPMCGSGVVPFSAQKLSRRAYGRDIDPLAVLLTRSLCAQVSAKRLTEFCDDVLDEARKKTRGVRTAARYIRALPEEDKVFLRYWFPERAVIQLFALARAIFRRKRSQFAVPASAVLSSVIISRGAGASYAMDLSRSRPHKVKTKIPRKPFDIWVDKATAFSKFFSASESAPLVAEIARGDARALDISDGSVDAVITSPPYLDAIDYLRTSKFSLIFFGAHLDVLRQIRGESIGTRVGLAPSILPMPLERLVARRVADQSRAPLIRRYLHDLRKALVETARVLRPGGVALYVLGPSILSRRSYDSVEVFSRVAVLAGLQPMASARRDLSEANRSLPPPNRRRRADSLNRRMTCEYYVVLRKPGR